MNQLSISAMIFFACWIFARRAVYCRYVDEQCIESRKTAAIVQSCPETLFSWKEREKEKNCSSIEHNYSRPLVYHCVINPWQNTFIEVCAPSTQINQGFCAEYNTGGARIQDSSDCSTCMTKYWSTDAYKYKECYDPVYKLHNSYNNSKTTYMVEQDTITPATITQPRKATLQFHVMSCAGSQKKEFVMHIMFTICFSMTFN